MPRWRTMIEPAVTVCPSPAFTPSRWPTLSRPFFELEPAFLWAMLLLVLLRGAGALRLCRCVGSRSRIGSAGLRARPLRLRLRLGLLGRGLGRLLLGGRRGLGCFSRLGSLRATTLRLRFRLGGLRSGSQLRRELGVGSSL